MEASTYRYNFNDAEGEPVLAMRVAWALGANLRRAGVAYDVLGMPALRSSVTVANRVAASSKEDYVSGAGYDFVNVEVEEVIMGGATFGVVAYKRSTGPRRWALTPDGHDVLLVAKAVALLTNTLGGATCTVDGEHPWRVIAVYGSDECDARRPIEGLRDFLTIVSMGQTVDRLIDATRAQVFDDPKGLIYRSSALQSGRVG